jgi:hypothetical protein
MIVERRVPWRPTSPAEEESRLESERLEAFDIAQA